MTATKKNSKVKEFELNKEFEKYSDITRIYTIGKVLILEHCTGILIQSPYYSDDSIKTIKTLRNTLVGNKAINVEFNIDGFLGALAQLLTRSILLEAAQEEAQITEEQQERNSIQEAINQLKQQHQNITSEEWTCILEDKYQNLFNVVQNRMPEIWPGLEFELAILRILNIEGCTLPFVGVILGRPSSYKTAIISLLKRWHKAFYTDNFTARSFVSHSTAVNTKEELAEIDMLPKIKGRLFLTPELSPMFTAKEDDLVQLLGIITRIADGHGYVSDSGAHGHRGYDEDIMFTWVAAAVDVPYKVYKVLGNLGSKLYFFRMKFEDETTNELLNYATVGQEFNKKTAQIKDALFDYLKWFEIGPKMYWDQTKDDKTALTYIVMMADVLSYLRCVAQVWETHDTQGSDYAYSISQREHPRRAITSLSNLARGHALLTGRNYITLDDVPIIIKTALDTAQIERVSLFSLLIAHGGKLTTSQILDSLNVSRPTVLRTMAEFKAIGLVTIEEEQETGVGRPSKKMVLNSRFNWFLSDELIKKFSPHTTSINKIVGGIGENFLNKLESEYQDKKDVNISQNEASEASEDISRTVIAAGDTPNNGPVQLTSDIEQSRDLGKYDHLIETEYLQSLGQTAYHCKEHPNIWDTDLKGLEISHFEPVHNNDN